MAKDTKKTNKPVTIVIRRSEEVTAGHHGGAWKVAYADFVTAMMAFFLLMWLLSATTEEQRRGLADYFNPTSEVSRVHSGSGLPLSGKTAFEDGSMVSDMGAVRVITGPVPVPDDADQDDSDTPAKPRVYRRDGDQLPAQPKDADAQGGKQDQPNPNTEAEQRADAQARERRNFEEAAEQIRQAVQSDPAMANLARQLAIDVTPEGLRIQILDEDKQPMFAFGSAAPNDRARMLLQKIGPVLAHLTEEISIAGHTDAAPYPGPGRTNWELSAERANATRRLLLEAGLPELRVRNVTGNADRDPLLPATPLAAANRRIAITVLRKAGLAGHEAAPSQAPAAPAPASATPASSAPASAAPRPASPALEVPTLPVPSPAASPPIPS